MSTVREPVRAVDEASASASASATAPVPSEPSAPSVPAPEQSEPQAAAAGPTSAIRRRLKQRPLPAVARPCAYYLLSRVAVLFAALGAKWFTPHLHLFDMMARGWDGHWYTLIAQHGYPHRVALEGHGSPWAFFPAWPAAIRATVEVTHLPYTGATLLLSVVLGLTSAVAVWLAVREVFGPVIADRAVLLYVFFPTAYVLSLGYSEALFITACGVCLYALSRHLWLTAALAAVVGGLTRNFGVVLIACVVVAAGHAFLTTRKVRPLLAVAVAPLGFAAWLLYSWSMVGTPFAFLHAERFWGNGHFIWFLTPFLSFLDLFTGTAALRNGQVVMCAIGAVFAYVGIVLLAKARDKGVSIPMFWWVFTIAAALSVFSAYEPGSVLRYSMVVITAYAAYAWRMRSAWEGPVVGMLGMAQGMLMFVALTGSLHPNTAHLWP